MQPVMIERFTIDGVVEEPVETLLDRLVKRPSKVISILGTISQEARSALTKQALKRGYTISFLSPLCTTHGNKMLRIMLHPDGKNAILKRKRKRGLQSDNKKTRK